MHVGVFLKQELGISSSGSLPHACGGVSVTAKKRKVEVLSSPCMWGCFPPFNDPDKWVWVFPMHVGVFLAYTFDQLVNLRLPHACGGVSIVFYITGCYTLSSPCMWGCFFIKSELYALTVVFPMHVGVFLLKVQSFLHGVSLPHACGGVSN